MKRKRFGKMRIRKTRGEKDKKRVRTTGWRRLEDLEKERRKDGHRLAEHAKAALA